MTTTTPLPAAALAQTSPDQAARVLAGQLTAYLAQLRDLRDADWTWPTDCVGWDVRQIAAHVAGSLDESAHLPVMLRHLRAARRRRPAMAMVDGLNAEQLADRAGRAGPRIADEIELLAPRVIRRRRKTPALVRRRRVPGNDLPAGSTFGYLFDVIYARDLWMHRVDTARATGRELAPADGETQVVEQVIRDLARFWTGTPWLLELTGRSGGSWLIGNGAPTATVRANTVGYLRLLSGRHAGPPIAASAGEPVLAEAMAARVAF